ncbi:trypsin-like peptidase domain-containing protein [Oscillospiraceae bacterium PP1C4]
MNDNFNLNENSNSNSTPNNETENSTQNTNNNADYFANAAPTEDKNQKGNPTNVWSVPPQDGPEYRAPYNSDPYRQSSQPPHHEQPPMQQYSTSAGWQQKSKDTPPHGKQPYQWNFSDYEQAQAVKPKRKKKGLMVFSIVMASVFVVSLLSFAGVGIYSTFNRTDQSNATTDNPSLKVPAGNLPSITLQDKPQVQEDQLPEGKLTTEQIVDKVEPSIVAITTYINYQNYKAEGMGSGIIIRDDGYIVTNAHVVDGAIGVTVQLSDGTQHEGRVVGLDTKTDLAVVKVDAKGLSAATFGNSDQTKVGEKVIAIGNPQSMDFYGSVTQGIVSGLNRSLTAGNTNYTQLIQTDAAINPGNSGGALVNEYGQIIGINSAKVITTGAEGMGFAIPASTVKPVVNDLIQHGRVTGRVRLGITATAVDEVLARLNNVPTGLFVKATDPDSDISKKGVVPGDIITKVNGNEIDSFQSLTSVIQDKKPGETVELEVYRPGSRSSQNGKFFNITVKLLEDMGTPATQAPSYSDFSGSNPNPETQPPANEQLPPDESLEDFFNNFFS